jgi:hypothetical protein
MVLAICFSCNQKSKEIVIIPDAEKDHRQRNHIFGEAKTITTCSYYISQQAEIDTTYSNKILYSKSIQNYSPDGFLTSIISMDENEDTVSIRKIHYSGDAKQQYWVLATSDGKVVDSCHYDYDISGFLAKEKRFSMDSLYYQISYKTDAMGNVIEMWLDNGEFVLYNTLQYNNDGLLIRTNEYSPDNKLFKFSTIEYDNYGDEVNRRVFKQGNEIIEYTYTEYDEKGRILSKIYEDRMSNYREDYQYPTHDNFGNWTVEQRKIGNNMTNSRERSINYY